jgi:hypothetical protein
LKKSKIKTHTIISIIVLFVSIYGCKKPIKNKHAFETLVHKNITDIRMRKSMYPNNPILNDTTVSLNNYVFSSIEISTNANNYYRFTGNKPFYKVTPLQINGSPVDKQLADKKIENSFIVKKDTLYYLRSFFNKQKKNLNLVNTLILVKPIAIFQKKDSLYTYYKPIIESNLLIEKSKPIIEKTNSSFNTGSVRSSWAISKTHLKLGSIHFYGKNKFGSSDRISKEEDIKHSLAQFTPDSLQIDNYKGNRYKNFQYFKKGTKHGYVPYFNEANVLNNNQE